MDAQTARVAIELRDFLAKQCRGRGRQRHRFGRANSRAGAILAPAVDFTIARLRRTAGRNSEVLANSAWNDLRQHLSARLAFALRPTLRVLEGAARFAGCRDGMTLLEAITEFPDLLNTAALLNCAWISAHRELLARIRRDADDIRATFPNICNQLSLRRIRPGLSDPHDGGQTATILQFGSGRPLIYKPRSANGEKIWFETLRWLNRNGFSFRIPTMLARRNYLWMEVLHCRECATIDQVRRFYFRWGAQAAIAQLLGAIDLHRENWLAVGSQPVLVDAEFIGRAQPPSWSNSKALDLQSLPALLETGLLPLTWRDRVGEYRGIAPFDATIAKTDLPKCWPRYNWQLQPPAKYLNDLLRGFEAVRELFDRPRVVTKFFVDVIMRRTRPDRILFRATAQYSRLLRESLQARNMTSENSRWRYLARECCETALTREIGLAEADALIRGDVPKFKARVTAPLLSWERFSTAIGQLKNSSRLLRSRVSLRARGRRGFNTKRKPCG